MGMIINAECSVCGYKKELYTGGGLMDCDFSTILGSFPVNIGEALIAARDNGAEGFSIDRSCCVCGGCGNIYSSAVVRYIQNNTERKVFDNCPLCGGSHKIFCGNGIDYPVCCPECGGRINFKQTGFWD